jgi:hypothetical protein
MLGIAMVLDLLIASGKLDRSFSLPRCDQVFEERVEERLTLLDFPLFLGWTTARLECTTLDKASTAALRSASQSYPMARATEPGYANKPLYPSFEF